MSTRTEYPDRIEWKNEHGELHRLDGPAIDMDGEWLEGENTICGSDVLKCIYITYNSDEPFIYYEWY